MLRKIENEIAKTADKVSIKIEGLSEESVAAAADKFKMEGEQMMMTANWDSSEYKSAIDSLTSEQVRIGCYLF